MTPPAPAKSHHTVWVSGPIGAARADRCAVDRKRIVCVGDRELATEPDPAHVSAAVDLAHRRRRIVELVA